MTRARQSLISLESTPFYHCISRCVRRAFLCGEDAATGKNFAHRRQWIVDRLQWLGTLFALDICAYAIMSNHYHVILRIHADKARDWSEVEVCERWQQLFSLPLLIQRYLKGETGEAENAVARGLIAEWRLRLQDISWFMRALNEPIARQANREDGCTGRFWEGRFKSQALLDEAALLTCMAYVDLNPIRAGLAETPEMSDFTSVQQRIIDWATQSANASEPTHEALPATAQLLPFRNTQNPEAGLPCTWVDYLEWVDWAGRAIRPNKRGAIPEHAPKILQRLGLDGERFLHYVQRQDTLFTPAFGQAQTLRATAKAWGKSFLRGMATAKALFSAGFQMQAMGMIESVSANKTC